MSVPMHQHANGLTRFARDLRKVGPAVFVELKGKIAEAGELVAENARARAKSRRVAGTVRVRAATGSGVAIVAGVGEKKPHLGEAKAFENKGQHGTFRHPVPPSSSVWVSQRADPILHDALTETEAAVALLMSKAVDNAAREFLEGDYI